MSRFLDGAGATRTWYNEPLLFCKNARLAVAFAPGRVLSLKRRRFESVPRGNDVPPARFPSGEGFHDFRMRGHSGSVPAIPRERENSSQPLAYKEGLSVIASLPEA